MTKELTDTKSYFHFLNRLTESLNYGNSIQKSCEEIILIIKNCLYYNLATIHLFNEKGKLQLRGNFGIDIFPEKELIDKVDFRLLAEKFEKQQKPIFFTAWKEEKELSTIFIEFKKLRSIAILPIIFNKRLLGTIGVGYLNKHEFGISEIRTLEVTAKLISDFLGMYILHTYYQKQVDELNRIIKMVRHDFANDIQSISLALELLTPSELNDNQQKYISILNNAKNSAIKKLTELKGLKEKHEKTIEINIGIPLKG
ncbi:MAG TPA: GAF domain-containing protein [candidate division Zixibacteria bacterium]|nr:GAF domain-containing protein [candidate division Zixibacteria bacterium]